MTFSPSWIAVAKTADFESEGATKSFVFRDENGFLFEGFAIRYRGQIHAYLNRCPHIPLSLDYGDGEFFDEQKQWLICRNHGAVFDPSTGQCVAGPCCGASLQRLALQIIGDTVAIEPPPAPELE